MIIISRPLIPLLSRHFSAKQQNRWEEVEEEVQSISIVNQTGHHIPKR